MYLPTERRTRTYRFPYDPQQENALYEAMRRKARGERMMVEMKKKEEGDKDPTKDDHEMIVHPILHEGLPTKETHDGRIVEGKRSSGPDDMGQQRAHDPIIIQMPGGAQIAIEPGSSFMITPDGEIQTTTLQTVPASKSYCIDLASASLYTSS